jgi:hypothetical protein
VPYLVLSWQAGGVTVSPEDRRRFERQVAALREHEVSVDAQVTGEQRAAVIAAANDWRRDHGLPVLVNDEDEHPELALHRRAAALGLLDRSG